MIGRIGMTRRDRMWRTARRVSVTAVVAALAAVAAVVVVFAPSPAQAAPPNAGIIRNWQTGRCLDANWSGQVYTLGCNGGNFQRWTIRYDSVARGWEIRNNETGTCLDAETWTLGMYYCGGGGGSFSWSASSATNEGWKKVQFRHEFSGWCLDSNYSGSVYLLGCNGGGYQNWRADGSM